MKSPASTRKRRVAFMSEPFVESLMNNPLAYHFTPRERYCSVAMTLNGRQTVERTSLNRTTFPAPFMTESTSLAGAPGRRSVLLIRSLHRELIQARHVPRSLRSRSCIGPKPGSNRSPGFSGLKPAGYLDLLPVEAT